MSKEKKSLLRLQYNLGKRKTTGFISTAAASERCHCCVKKNTTLNPFFFGEGILSRRLWKFTAKHDTANAEDLNLSGVLIKIGFMVQNAKCKAEKIYHIQRTEIQTSILKTRK